MKIAVGGIFHETNTFASQKTSFEQFQNHTWLTEDEIIENFDKTNGSIGGIIEETKKQEVTLIPTFYAEATPSGMVDHKVFEEATQRIIEKIPKDIDGVILVLHGAMVTSELHDPEGELVRRIRAVLEENKPIACTLDLHANISESLTSLADVLVGFDTYPHEDYYERAVEAAKLLFRTIRGEITPYIHIQKPLFMPVVQKMLTSQSPMKNLMEKAWEIEKDKNVLNVTVAGGFPYADVKEAGFSFLVTTNQDQHLARKYGEELENELWSLKEQFVWQPKSPEEAIKEAKEQANHPVILVDSSDNIGGGSSADGTVFLSLLLKENMEPSLVFIKDSEAVKKAEEIGIGKSFQGEIGGKTDNLHGSPVNIKGKVTILSDGYYTSERTGEKRSMGKSAVVKVKGINIVLTTERVPSFDLQAPRTVGIEPSKMRYIVVKGAIQWKASYGLIAGAEVEGDCPGVTSSKLERFPYENVRANLYPIFNEEGNYVK